MDFFRQLGYHSVENRCFFQFSGPDAERYLNGQVTNDVVTATFESSIYAFTTNAKGKLQGELFIHRLNEQTFLCDGPLEIRENLFARLDQYLIADDLELKDVSKDWQLTHYSIYPEHLSDNQDLFIRKTNRYGLVGWDILSEQDLKETLCSRLDENKLESLRISTKTPLWGNELLTGMLPQEANLDEKAISFDKGCYVGQEIISRIKSIGRVNKKLVSIKISQALPDTSSLYLYTKESSSVVGEITSISPIPEEDGSISALAYLKRKAINNDCFYIGDLDHKIEATVRK